jgi:hypothetical protein
MLECARRSTMMKERNSPMKKPTVLLAAAVLVISTGVAAAKTRDHRPAGSPYGTAVNGDQSSTNVLAGAGTRGYRTPHEVPENGGAASIVQPGSSRR